MKKIDIMDPHELKKLMGYKVTEPRPVPDGVTNPDAIKLWNTVMVKVKNDRNKIIVNSPESASSVFGKKVEFYLTDVERLSEKFSDDELNEKGELSASTVYNAIGTSKSTWNRWLSGALPDLERGNVFATALALRLNEDETADLLYSAGFALNYELDLDACVMYFIKNGIYDLDRIKAAMSDFSDIDNGFDCFIFRPKWKKHLPKRIKLTKASK